MTTWAQRASAPKKPATAQQSQPGQSAASAAPAGKAVNGRSSSNNPGKNNSAPPKNDINSKAPRAPSPTKSSKSISPVRPQQQQQHAAPIAAGANSNSNSSNTNIRAPSPANKSPKSSNSHIAAATAATSTSAQPAAVKTAAAPPTTPGRANAPTSQTDSRSNSPTKLSFAAAAAKSAAAAAKVSAGGKSVNGVSAEETQAKAGKEVPHSAGKPPVASSVVNGQQTKGNNASRDKPPRQNSTPAVGNEAPVVQFKGAYKKMQQTNQANLVKKPSFGSFDAEASKSVGAKPAVKDSAPAAHPPPQAADVRTPNQASVARTASAPPVVKPQQQQKPSVPAQVPSSHEHPIPANPAPTAFSPVAYNEHVAPGAPVAPGMVSAPLPNQVPVTVSTGGIHPPHSAPMHHAGHQMHPHAQPPHHTGYPQHQQAAHYGMVHPGYPQQQGYRGPPQQMPRPPMAPPQNRPFRQPLPHSMPMGMSQSGAPQQAMAAAVPGGGPQMFYPDPNMIAYYQHQAEAYQHHQYMQQQQFMNYNQPRYMMPQHGPIPPNARYPNNAPTQQQPPSTPKANKPRVAINLKTPDGKAIVLPHQTPTITHAHVHPAASTAARTADVPAPVKVEPPKNRVSVVLTNPNTGAKQVMGAHDDGAAVPKSPVEESAKKPQADAAALEKPAVKPDEKKDVPAAATLQQPAKTVPAENNKPVQVTPVVEKEAAEVKAPETKPVPAAAKGVPALKTEIKDVQTLVKPKSAEAEKPKAVEKAVETKPAEIKKIVPVKATDKENVMPAATAAAPVAPKAAAEPKTEVQEPASAPAPAPAAASAPKEQVKAPETEEVKPTIIKEDKHVTKEDKSAPKEDVAAAIAKEDTKPPALTAKTDVQETAAKEQVVSDVSKETKPVAPKQDAKPVEPAKVEKADKPAEPELEEGEIREPAAAQKPSPEAGAKRPSVTSADSAGKPTATPAKIDTSRPSVMTRLQSFEGINYPNSIASPTHEPGQPFQYQRDFLMQFANIIKDKPEGMASLEQIFDDRGTSPRDGRGSKGPGSRPVSRQGSVTDVRGGGPAPKTSEERFAQAMSSKHGGSMGVQGVMGVMSGVAAPPGSRMSRQPSNRAIPGVVRQQSFDSRGPQQHRNDGRGSRGARGGGPQMGRPGMGRTDTVMDLNLEPVEPLSKSESAWGPGAFKKELAKEGDDKEKVEEALIARKMKGLLNKLTIEKFDAISDQILNIGMTRESIVKGVISQIFEKALDEPNFGAMYAQLCHKLFVELPNVQSWIHRDLTDSEFRRALLSRCQEEFERSAKWTASEAALTEQRREARTRLDSMTDEEKLAIAEEDYQRQKLKRRVLGNISFIGELFIKSLISERIMHRNCIAALLKPTNENADKENADEAPEEEDVESLCKLLTTIGPHLEAKGKPLMDQYFKRIAELSVHPKLSARIRFMLLDLIDMRKDNWKARTEAAGPKTLVEIRVAAEKAAAAEEAAIQERNRNSHGGRGGGGGGGGGGGRGRGGDQFRDRRGGGRGSHDNRGSSGGGHTNSDGWTTQGGSNRNSQSAAMAKPGDLTGFGKMAKAPFGPPTLGPTGSFGKGGSGGWNLKKKDGPAGAALSRSQSNVGEVTTTANVFSILSHHDTDRKKSVDEGRRPSISAPAPASPEKAKPAATETSAPAAAAGGKKVFTAEERTKKFEGIVQEWQSLLDTNEVKLSLQDLNVAEHHAEFITILLNGTWDKKPDVVKRTRKLIVWLLSENVITPEDVKTALAEQLDMAEDIAIDVPSHWKDLGELLSRLLSDAVISFDDVLKASSTLIASRALKNPPALKLLKETLLDIVRHDKEAGLMTIVGSTNLAAFFQEKKRDEPNAVQDWCLEVGLPVALAAPRGGDDAAAAAPPQ
ncbi:hypothetical protein HDU86_006277 [Geranomyces michiganensis]|nr:hypothetical protein HDU86_006277 [Geranomyces michiganensis]